jgi:hypothetical protein
VLLASAALASVLLVLSGVAGHEEFVAYAAPVLVLVLPLLAGRFFGEEWFARVVARSRRRRRVGVPVVARTSRRVAVLLPRGGRLIASALAKRPPPASALG